MNSLSNNTPQEINTQGNLINNIMNIPINNNLQENINETVLPNESEPEPEPDIVYDNMMMAPAGVEGTTFDINEHINSIDVTALPSLRIPLNELKYWSVDKQEPYFDAHSSLEGELSNPN